jgi:hypothetical protein
MEISYYYLIVESIGKEGYKNRYIIKDVSASIFQNLVKLLGYKNDDSLK